MGWKAWLNIGGLLLTLAAIWLMAHKGPENWVGIDGGTPSTDFSALGKAARRRNLCMKIGAFAATVGAIAMFAASFTMTG